MQYKNKNTVNNNAKRLGKEREQNMKDRMWESNLRLTFVNE